MSRRIPRLTGARPTNEQTRLMNFTPYLADVAGRGVLISFRSAYGSLRPHPRFCFTSGHLSVCDGTDPVWSAQRLAGTVPLRLVGRNGVGKTRLLRLLAGLDSPAGGHIERAAAVAWVAQQPTLTPETTLATLLGYASVFAALSRLEQGQGLADDFDLLDGHWDLTDRLSLAFREADLPPFSADRPAFSLSGGERMKALLCGAFVSGADYLLLDEPTNHLTARGGVALSPTGKLAGRGSDRQPRPRAADADAEDY